MELKTEKSGGVWTVWFYIRELKIYTIPLIYRDIYRAENNALSEKNAICTVISPLPLTCKDVTLNNR